MAKKWHEGQSGMVLTPPKKAEGIGEIVRPQVPKRDVPDADAVKPVPTLGDYALMSTLGAAAANYASISKTKE